MVDLLGGQIAMLALPEGLLLQHHAAGRLRMLATSGAERSPFVPNVPSVVEQGFPTLVMREWFGFFLPGGTPPAIAERMADAVHVAAVEPALRSAFASMAMVPVTGTPAAMANRIAAERPSWQTFLAASGIRVDG